MGRILDGTSRGLMTRTRSGQGAVGDGPRGVSRARVLTAPAGGSQLRKQGLSRLSVCCRGPVPHPRRGRRDWTVTPGASHRQAIRPVSSQQTPAQDTPRYDRPPVHLMPSGRQRSPVPSAVVHTRSPVPPWSDPVGEDSFLRWCPSDSVLYP